MQTREDRLIQARRYRREHRAQINAYYCSIPGLTTKLNSYIRRCANQNLANRTLKLYARKAVSLMVRLGKVEKPETCSICGYTPPTRHGIHGHHEDPRRATEITWVCAKCHFSMDPHPNQKRTKFTHRGGQVIPNSQHPRICDLYHKDRISQLRIAKKYGVHHSTISKIINRYR